MSAARKMDFSPSLLVSSEDHFNEVVDVALTKRKIKVAGPVKNYIVDVLIYFLDAENLYPKNVNESDAANKKELMMAEQYLMSLQKSGNEKIDNLKKLADKSLYVSGFFGDSFQRKLIDIDYYINLGCTAYDELSDCIKQEEKAEVYKTLSSRFIDFVDVLTLISQETFIQSNKDILRLYDRFIKTNSDLAREKLIEMGLINLNRDQLKSTKQD